MATKLTTKLSTTQTIIPDNQELHNNTKQNRCTGNSQNSGKIIKICASRMIVEGAGATTS